MGLFDSQNTMDALEDLLEREKAFILKGNIDGVRRLSVEKERLLKRLGRTSLQREKLAGLRRKADRNNELLAASARGFRAVQDRLRALTQRAEGLSTYGRDGQKAQLGNRRTDFNKRA